jgi:hypothetical protein
MREMCAMVRSPAPGILARGVCRWGAGATDQPVLLPRRTGRLQRPTRAAALTLLATHASRVPSERRADDA